MVGASVFDHPWQSGLFAEPEVQAIWSADVQLRHMLRFEAAWSRALGAAGRISQARAYEVAAGIEAFQPDMAALAESTSVDGVLVPGLVAQLKVAFGAEGVHSGATSQDIVDTALVLSIVDTIELLQRRIQTLGRALEGLEARHGAARLMGRTRMQAATPITVADRIAGWRMPLESHKQR